MRRRFHGILAAAAITLGACSSQSGTQVPVVFDNSPHRILYLIWDGKPEQAVSEAESMIAELPPPQTQNDSEKVAQTLVFLCQAQTELEDYDAAEKSCLDAIETFEKDYGSGSRTAPLDAYKQVFNTYEHAGYHPGRAEAEIAIRQRFLEKLPMQPILLGARVETLTRIGDLQRSTGKWQEAEAAYLRGIDLTDRLPRDAGGAATDVYRRLALFYRERGRTAEAEATLKSGMAQVTSEYGADHYYAADFYVSLAALYVREWRREDALPFSRKALAIYEQSGGKRAYRAADALLLLALLQDVRPQGTAEGERLLNRALDIRAKKFGTDSLGYASALAQVALFHQLRQDYPKWERFARQAAEIIDAHYGPEHIETAQRYISLAAALHFQGKDRAALPFAEKAYGTLRDMRQPPPSDFEFTLKLLTKIYDALGRDAERRAIEERLDAQDPLPAKAAV